MNVSETEQPLLKITSEEKNYPQSQTDPHRVVHRKLLKSILLVWLDYVARNYLDTK